MPIQDKQRLHILLKDEVGKLWQFDEEFEKGIYRFYNIEDTSLCCCASLDVYNGYEFIHLSISRIGSVPDLHDIELTRRQFIGDDSQAILTLRNKKDGIPKHPWVVHVYKPLSMTVIPNFEINEK